MAGNSKPKIRNPHGRKRAINTRDTSLSVQPTYVDSQEQLEAQLYATFYMPLNALLEFEEGRAHEVAWRLLQFHLYVAEELPHFWDNIIEDVQLTTAHAIQQLYVVGRRYNASDFKDMSATKDELDDIRVAIGNSIAMQEVTSPRILFAIYQRVEKILSVKPAKK